MAKIVCIIIDEEGKEIERRNVYFFTNLTQAFAKIKQLKQLYQHYEGYYDCGNSSLSFLNERGQTVFYNALAR